MSEGIIFLGPNQQPSLKRCRAEDLDSGGSSGRSDCQYGRCRRPARIHDKFCGPTHKDFFMSDLVDIHEHGGAYMTEQQSRVCKLPGCDLLVWVDSDGEQKDFCRKRHALKYIEGITLRWALNGRLCKLEGCIHHVWVDESTKKCDDFCIFEHAIQAAASKGLSSFPKKPRIVEPAKPDAKGQRSDEIRQESASQEVPRQKAFRGCHEKISDEAIERCLIYLLKHQGDFEGADPDGNFCIGKNITDFHPWELFEELFNAFEGEKSFYILGDFDPEQKREWGTKHGFTYKQTSGRHRNKSAQKHLETLYHFYRYKEDIDDPKNDHFGEFVKVYRDYEAKKRRGSSTRWKLHEIVLSDDVVKKFTGEAPRRRPVIWKLFQDKKGEPVWPPPTKTRAVEVPGNKRNVPDAEGTFPEGTFGVEVGMTSSISSNASSVEGLPPGVQTLRESSNSNEFGGFEYLSLFLMDDLPNSIPNSPANVIYSFLDDSFAQDNGGCDFYSSELDSFHA